MAASLSPSAYPGPTLVEHPSVASPHRHTITVTTVGAPSRPRLLAALRIILQAAPTNGAAK